MKKIITIVLSIIVLIWILLNTLSVMNLSLFGIRTYRIASQSMTPYLKVNDIILIKNEKDYNVGDVVTYKDNNSYITHRIVNIDNNQVTTKGDNNDSEDKPFSKDKIVGKMIYKFKILSLIRYMLDRPSSWIIIFIISIIIIVLIPVKIDKKE